MGEEWWRQDFCCEFLQTSAQLFAEAAIQAAFTDVPQDDMSDVVWS